MGLQYFIRKATASTIAHRMRFLSEPVKKAAECAVEDLRKDGGIGGVIVLDRQGNGMYLHHFITVIRTDPSYSGNGFELSRDVSWCYTE